jgi:menaquinone-9 beta-reductase
MQYDVSIIGGGLAGLALSIQLAERGWKVVLFERETYPFHRVCGEYISMEAWDFLCSLSLPLPHWNLPRISRLQVSAPNGALLQAPLPLGGFGVSRYKLDAALANVARSKGVQVHEATKVENIKRTDAGFVLQVRNAADQQTFAATACCGAWGKRSNIDVAWQRPFITDKGTRISSWVGIKYHIRTGWPPDLIGLHNFRDGYCGISKIEDGWYCLCYLTRAANLKGVPVHQLEKGLMSRNAALKNILQNSERKPGFPLAISQVSFRPKTRVENGVLLLGDAAGMIAPLCGNGMSMALHASKIAAGQINLFLSGKQDRAAMEKMYEQEWQTAFANRLRTGRALQRFFGSERGSNLMVSVMSRLPSFTHTLIRKTHGAPF